MSRIRKITMTLGTGACALGIGFFVQNGEKVQTAQAPVTKAVQTAVIEPVIAPIVNPEPALDIQGIVLTSALPDTTTPQRLVEPKPDMPRHNNPVTPGPSESDMSSVTCAVTATANPAPMANVDLVVFAPCFGNERVTVHHNGMMFTEATDTNGILAVTVPALTKNAVFIMAFTNGKGAVAMTRVSDLADYSRVVLQWAGEGAFQIHAREFGADYGTAGHIWFGMDDPASSDQHGSIIRLGDADALAPQMAEIYTYPIGMSERSGTVSMSVETEVTADNCAKVVVAQTLELGANSQLRTRDMELPVPDCSAIGDFLVLNNLVDDMKIAAN